MWIFNSLIIAIAMYSKIPMPQAEWNEKNMRYAMCFFPVVGVVIGAAEFAAGYALLHWLHCKPLLFSVAMTLIPVLITGGIHLDGFADTVDAMSSYAERERRLEILKDPHTGAFAIIGLCCYFLANVGIWSEIGEKKLLVACCIFAFSRAMSGLAVVSFKAAKNSGLLRTFQDGAAKRRVRVVMMLWAVLTAFILLKISPAAGTAALAMGIAIYVYYYLFSRKYFGGTTGDLAGYFMQLRELGMLAGIMLDTKNFVLRTGVRTFEAAAFLRGKGADTVEVKRLFSNSISTYKTKYKLVSEAEIFNFYAIACADEETSDIRIAAAQAADELLGIENVKASFVMFPTKNCINISARSLGDVNVQVLMEKMGGGGHQTMAATQLKGVTMEEAREQLVQIVSSINREQVQNQTESAGAESAFIEPQQ